MKILQFLRLQNNILVEYKATLKDAENVSENFVISHPSKLDSYIEKQLFYHLDKKKWTLNELIFFADNNRLCLVIFDSNGDEVARYGECGSFCEFKINTQCFIVNSEFLKIN